jgi:hypothetical protein
MSTDHGGDCIQGLLQNGTFDPTGHKDHDRNAVQALGYALDIKSVVQWLGTCGGGESQSSPVTSVCRWALGSKKNSSEHRAAHTHQMKGTYFLSQKEGSETNDKHRVQSCQRFDDRSFATLTHRCHYEQHAEAIADSVKQRASQAAERIGQNGNGRKNQRLQEHKAATYPGQGGLSADTAYCQFLENSHYAPGEQY